MNDIIKNKITLIRVYGIQYAVLIGILLSPFDIKVKVSGMFMTPVELFISIAMVLWIPEGWKIICSKSGKRILIASSAFILIALAGMANAVAKMSVIKETIQFAWFIAAIFLTWWVLRNEASKKFFHSGLLIITGAISIFGIIQYVLIRVPIHFLIADTRIRATAYYDQPNAFGNYLVASLLLSFFYFLSIYQTKKNERKQSFSVYLILMVLFLSSLAFAATFSRGSWIGFGLAIMIGSIGIIKSSRIVVIALLGLFVFSFAVIQYDKSQQPTIWLEKMYASGDMGVNRSFSNQERLLLLKTAWNMTLKNPVLGIGFGNYPALLDSYASPELQYMLRVDFNPEKQQYYYNPAKKPEIETVHNILLQILCESGILGLLAFLWFWTEIILLGAKKLFQPIDGKQDLVRIGAFCAMIGSLIAGLFGWPFVHGVQEIFIASCALAIPKDAFHS